jgi:hypothetical protein
MGYKKMRLFVAFGKTTKNRNGQWKPFFKNVKKIAPINSCPVKPESP